MLEEKIAANLIAHLNSQGVQFCHWKSNWSSHIDLKTIDEFDFLVNAPQRQEFEEILNQYGFVKVIERPWAMTKGVAHYYGFEVSNGNFVHLHVYYELNTAGEILKNYHFEIESELLKLSTQGSDGIFRPAKEVELILLLARKLLEHASPVELLMLLRGRNHVNSELFALVQNVEQWDRDREQIEAVFLNLFPDLNWDSFNQLARKFISTGVSWQLLFDAPKICGVFKKYRSTPFLRAELKRIRRLFMRLFYRCLGRRAHRLSANGIIVAVVGSDASGKTTVVKDLSHWLGSNFDTLTLHVGRPPATLATFLMLKFIPLMRRLMPNSRTVNISLNKSREIKLGKLSATLFSWRAWMVAHDRLKLLLTAQRAKGNGRIVICDRYPALNREAMDCPVLDPSDQKLQEAIGYSELSRAEGNLYQNMPQADCILRMKVDLDKALLRNANRQKSWSEGDDWIRYRHALALKSNYAAKHVFTIDANGNLENTIKEARIVVWKLLALNKQN